MANLAYTRKSQGRDEEAIDLMKEATRLQGQRLGIDHPDIMNSAQTLDEWLARTEISEASASSASEEVFPSMGSCQICDDSDQVE